MRDTPYSPDEKRASDYIQEITNGAIGSGDDPIGYILASHYMLLEIVKTQIPGGLLQALLNQELTGADFAPPTAEPEPQRP